MKSIVMGLLVVGMAAVVALPSQAQEFPFTINLSWGFNPVSAFACLPTDLPDATLTCGVLTPHRTTPIVPVSNTSVLWFIEGGAEQNPSYSGIGAIQFGFSYDATLGIASPQWILCTGGLQLPGGGWPATGGYNRITWAGGCYHPQNAAGMTKIGFIWFTSPNVAGGQFRIDPDPTVLPPMGGPGGAAVAATCGPEVLEVRICQQALGRASIGTTDLSFNTCGFLCAVPTQESTWGELKNTYR